jgi:hypothetical protein
MKNNKIDFDCILVRSFDSTFIFPRVTNMRDKKYESMVDEHVNYREKIHQN